jgi:hypothetical protein
MNQSVFVIAVAALGVGMYGLSSAQVYSGFFTNPVGQCDAALPVFDAMLRKRPTAIANMGNQTAFVSCSMPQRLDQDSPSGGGPQEVSIFFDDPARSSNATVTCTLVDGVIGAESPTPLQYVRSVAFSAGSSSYRWIVFNASDYGLERFRGPANLSCTLPPGTEMNDLFVFDQREF